MKTPTQYGSENEETSFIRRIAAPDRAHGNRKQKKRMAVVGATVGLIAASAVVGYAAMNQGASTETAIPAENMEAQFVSNPDGTTAHPSLAELDTNNNNQLEQGEFFNYLQNKLNADVDKINAASLPEDVKQSLVDRLSDNFESDINCAQKAFAANKKSKIKVTEKNLKTFFNGLDEFCPTDSVDVTDELLNKYTTAPPTEAPIVQTEAPFVETSAPFVEPVPEETKAPVTTWDEPATETPPLPVEWNTPSTPETQPPVVVAEEKKDDVVEQAAEAGSPAAIVEEEHHEDTVEQAAESGDSNAAVEEEHHEAQVEQAAEEGNEAAIKEEEHFQEQVEEATADAPPAVKEEEQAVQETEQAAESGDETAVEEVEQKQDELVEEAEEGNPEAAQEEEHLEVVEEQAANEGNAAAEEIVDHHEEEVQQTEEAATTTEETSSVAENDSNQESEGTAGDDTADIIQDLGGYDDNESPVEEGDKNWMTKEEFRQKLADHFQKESEYLDEVAAKAEEEYNQLSNHIQRLDDCIEQASNKFGWYGVYEEAPHYDNAVDWVANVCLQEGSN